MQKRNFQHVPTIVADGAGDNVDTFDVLDFAGYVSGKWRFPALFPELSKRVGSLFPIYDV
jgi:hypothetical protein